MKIFTLTTPLYYVNDVPHIGHAYTTIAADIVARWMRLNGRQVFFLTGTDEHGAKIAKAAADSGEAPQSFVNRISGEYKAVWKKLNIIYDDFIQTSSDRHKKVVQAVFEKLKADGHIYKGSYEGWYCLHDETYFTESELVDKKCPTCGRDVQKLKEDSYFFRLSQFEERLLKVYEKNPDFLQPPHRANEIINFVKSGLKDLSVSRTRVQWGIPVLSDPAHVVYVWIDALSNYISAPGYGDNQALFEQRWPADLHLVGKEIYRFHTVIWPAMLMALNLPLPKKVFAHGWWTVEGKKMSKSIGNVIDPIRMAEEYGTDSFRYFLFREVPFGADGDFSEKALLQRYNGELANNLGNLLQRTMTLLLKNFDGVIPPSQKPSPLLSGLGDMIKSIDHNYDTLNLSGILESGVQLLFQTNKFIDDQAPWKLGADQKEKLGEILHECAAVLKVVALVFYSFMPEKMKSLWERLGELEPIETQATTLARFRTDQPVTFFPGQKAIMGDPLFMRKTLPKK